MATTLVTLDRLKFTVFASNVGTMASDYTVACNYSGASPAASGDTYVSFVETITLATTVINKLGGIPIGAVKNIGAIPIANAKYIEGVQNV